MCGIAGIIDFRGPTRLHGPLRRMTRAMCRRGPDDEGIALFARSGRACEAWGGADTPAALYGAALPYAPQPAGAAPELRNPAVGLGHRRLSIIDLSIAGHQPLCSPDRRHWIVFNGEVYNYAELRAQLRDRGVSFVSECDTEVVLQAYCTWGPDCLTRLHGMWALAIWDNAEKTLFCSRDRIGIKPLYYTLTPELFMFASDIKTLIASGLYRARPDLASVYHAMSLQCGPRPWTCFAGVRELEPGHWMTIALDGARRTRQYWRVPLGQVDEGLTEETCAAQVRATLERAVARTLVADVPVATFMSGGIDSTLMAALAAQRHPGITALTLAFRTGIPEVDRHDELPQARATAEMYDMRHVVRDVQVDDGCRTAADVIRVWEEPLFPFAPGYLLAGATAAEGVRVVLNGLGPDELLCGYWHHKLPHAWGATAPWQKALGRHVPGLTPTLRRWRTHGKLRHYADCFVSTFELFSAAEKAALLVPDAVAGCDTGAMVQAVYGAPDSAFADGIQAACYYDLLVYVANHHMYRTDQETMHYSLEGRFPYLDHEFVELAFRIPSRLKVRGETGKHILRRVAEGLIAPPCLAMPKKGFNLPMAWWLRTTMREFARERLAVLKQRAFVRPAGLAALERASETDNDAALQLCFMLALELWLETFCDEPGWRADAA
jgi:asparagine synthase (glutamine-hydrolysing)